MFVASFLDLDVADGHDSLDSCFDSNRITRDSNKFSFTTIQFILSCIWISAGDIYDLIDLDVERNGCTQLIINVNLSSFKQCTSDSLACIINLQVMEINAANNCFLLKRSLEKSR